MHKRKARSFLSCLSSFGGLYSIVFKILGVLGEFVNERLIIGRMIEKTYFVKVKKEDEYSNSLAKKQTELTLDLKSIKFSHCDKFVVLKN